MKTRIEEIKSNSGFFRVYYEFDGGGETSSPFDTLQEAKAFEKGLRRCFEDYQDHLSWLKRKKELARQ